VIPPKPNLPPESQPWARYVEDLVSGLAGDVGVGNTNNAAFSQQLGATVAAAGAASTEAGVAQGAANAANNAAAVAHAAALAADEAAAAAQATADAALVATVPPSRPVAPTGLAAVAGAGWDAVGISPEAWFDMTWNIPALDVDGNPVSIAGYDIWGKKSTEVDAKFITTSPANTVRISVQNAELWSFQVKAASTFGPVSDLSEPVVVTANASIASPASPAPPTLSQYAGLLRIQWGGTGMVPQVKYVFASISTTIGGTYTRAGMPLNGAGEVVIPGLATSVNYYARINLVDELGQISSSSAAGPLLLDPITGTTIQTSNVANTGIKMTDSALTAYNSYGNPTFILDAITGEVWIAPYEAVFNLGATGKVATTGAATTGIAISSENSSFNTFIHPSGLQIRNDQTALSWWEADARDSSLVNFFSPRAVIGQRILVGDYEDMREPKTVGSRLVTRYRGA
jgi:hypothetical protein